MESSYTSSTTKPILRGIQVVWYILAVLEILLAFRFVLKMMGANSSSGFVSFIYGLTWPLAQPFISAFRVSRVEGSIFEWTTILAAAVYWLIAFGIIKIFLMSKTVSTPEAAAKLEDKDSL